MSKKSVLAAIFLIVVGIVFGVVLVSSFRGGIENSFAGDQNVQLGAPSQVKDVAFDAKGLSKAFIEVSKAVTPTVVTITVTTKAKQPSGDMNDFFHFFGPDNKNMQPEPQQGSGSGVIISPEGYIMTNNHVVEDADESHVEVTFSDNRTMKAKIIGTDPTTDLAVIKVEGKNLPTAAFGNSDALEVGEWVVAVGNPLGLQSTVTAGIISAIGRGNIGVIRDTYGIENFIQTDAAINPGNSGGPLVNLSGEVVGINAAIATTNQRYQGYGFAIPINLARGVAEDLIKHGKVLRGYIGVSIGAIDETTAKALGLGKARGVFVQSLVDGGAAEAAGLKEGDVILSIDGKEVNAANELQSFIARKHPGEEVVLSVFRDGKTIEKRVSLRSRKEEGAVVATKQDNTQDDESEANASLKELSLDAVGMSVRALTAEEKKGLKVDKGVVVSDVKHFGEAFNRGLRQGDVIVDVDKTPVTTPKELESAIGKRKSGDAMMLRVKRPGASGASASSAYIAIQIP
jgi:serine protease Do